MNHSREDIVSVEGQLQQAMVKNDVQALERLLHDELLFTDYTGTVIGKQEDLVSHASHALQLTELAFVESPVTRFYGETAIVVSTVVQIRLPKLDKSCSRRPESVQHSRCSFHIPGRYRLRCCPREDADWNVLSLDQR